MWSIVYLIFLNEFLDGSAILDHVDRPALRAGELQFVAQAVHVKDRRYDVLRVDWVGYGHLNLA